MQKLKSASAQRAITRAAAGVAAQARHVAAFLSTLPTPAFAQATRLPGWDLRLLTAHLVAQQRELIEHSEQPTAARPSSVADALRAGRARRRRSDAHVHDIAGNDDGPELARQLRYNVGEMVALIDDELPDVVGLNPPLRIRDALRLYAVDWIVHSDDINAVFGAAPVELDPQALADAVRCLAEALAEANPGRSIEVRVPPFSAVQCGTAGDPTHTRGTPPNVVEVEPLVFLRLATGRLTFDEALGHGLTASGTRADISAMLPVS